MHAEQSLCRIAGDYLARSARRRKVFRDCPRPGSVLSGPPRQRSRRDGRMAGIARAARRREGPRPRARDHAQPAEALEGPAPRRADGPDHRLHQHDRPRERARLPRRRGDRAPLPRLDPLERRRHRAPRAASRNRRRRSHLHLRLVRCAVRGRLQPLLPRRRPPVRRRPDLRPGARLPRHVRARLPRGPPDRGAARRLPSGEVGGAQRHPVVPAPASHAGVLAVPDRVDGSRSDQRHLPGDDEQVPDQPRHQGRLRLARLGVPRRRRDGRGREPRPAAGRRERGPGQPDVRRQREPSAARRPGPRQRQDHPGARELLPRRRLERHQGRLGSRVGRAARPRHRRRAPEPHERHPGRRLPDVQDRERRLRPRELLRPRRAHARPGQGLHRRPDLGPQARRSRLPQGVRGLQGGRRAQGPAHRHHRQDDQGLRPREALRGAQRDPPDEEDDPR